MIKIDFTADAAYVYVPWCSPGSRPVFRTAAVTDAINVDQDDDYQPIGVEVIGLKSGIPISELVIEYRVPDETIRELLTLSNASISAPEETQQ